MPKDLRDGRINPSTAARITPERAKELGRHRLLPGDLVFSRRGDVSRVALVQEHEAGFICGTGCLRARPNPQLAYSDFLFAVVQTDSAKRWLESNAVGQTMPNMNTKILSSLPLKIPSLPEQRTIAQIARAWDHSIQQLEHLVQLKRERKRGLMQVLLTGKKRFKEFANDPWHEHSLGQLILEVNERNKAGKHTKVLSVTNTRGFVLPEEVFSKRVASANLSNYKVVRAGQFAYNPSRLNVGSLGLLQGHELGLLSPMYVVFRTKAAVDSHYLYHWFQSDVAKGKILRSAEGSVRESVSFSALSRMSISLPSLQEQHRITSVLSTADAEIENLEKQLEAYKRQKRGLMQQLLTGKKRVEVDDMEAVA